MPQTPEDPWFPGALMGVYSKQARSGDEIVVFHSERIDSYPSYETYVLAVAVRPQIDQVVVASRKGDTATVRFEPL